MNLEDAREYLKYEPDTGNIYWIKPVCINHDVEPNSRAGGYSLDGYITIGFRQKRYRSHRLAWFLYYGEWPKGHIDHINRDKLDNRLENLRDVSNRKNCQNQPKFNYGAYRSSRGKPWRAGIQINGKAKSLGSFNTEELAQQAYIQACKELNDITT